MVRRTIAVVISILVLLFFAYVVTGHPNNTAHGELKAYNHPELGLSFDYPTNYQLTERVIDNTHRYHYNITLVDSAYTVPKDGEGPPAITIDVYQNNLDKQSLVSWLKGSSESNFKLSNGTYASTSIAGEEGVVYTWDGLYHGDTTAFIHNNYIYSFAVTYLDRSDQILNDYPEILRSIKFTNSEVKDNFSRAGVSVKNQPGLLKDVLYLLYEEPGKAAQYVILNFDNHSMCVANNGSTPCSAMNISDYGLVNGRKIKVDGNQQGETVQVRTLRYIE